jgi:hypothetical protein
LPVECGREHFLGQQTVGNGHFAEKRPVGPSASLPCPERWKSFISRFQ